MADAVVSHTKRVYAGKLLAQRTKQDGEKKEVLIEILLAVAYTFLTRAKEHRHSDGVPTAE